MVMNVICRLLYVCVLCASGGSSQCCILHDLQFVNTGRGCKWPSHFTRQIKDNILPCIFFLIQHCTTMCIVCL